MTQSTSRWFLAGLLLLTSPAFGGGTPCAEKTYKGEELLGQGDMAGAEPILTEAVKACRALGEKSARPYIALGTLYFRTQKPAKAVPLFEEGLNHEPGLTLAYMNLSAAYEQMKDFPKSIEAGKKAISSAHEAKDARLEAEASFNVGLALFSQAANAGKEDDLSSEPYFQASQKLMPSINQNYFYLGVINEIIRKKPKEALAFYHQGCELKHSQSCAYEAKLKARGSVNTQTAAVTAPAAKVELTPEEKELYGKIRKKFVARGIPEDKVDGMLADMQRNYAPLPIETRRTALRSIASQ